MGSQRASIFYPRPFRVRRTKSVDKLSILFSESIFRLRSTQKDVVVRLGCVENCWLRIGHLPIMAVSSALPPAASMCTNTYQVQRTPRRRKYRSNEWRISATPPPHGVALKKAISLFPCLRILKYLFVAAAVPLVTKCRYCSKEAKQARLFKSGRTSLWRPISRRTL